MENQVRCLPEWLTNISEQVPVTKKRGYQKEKLYTGNETARNDKRRRKDDGVTTPCVVEEYAKKPAKCDEGKVKTSNSVRARRVELSSSEDDSEVPGSAYSGSIKERTDVEDVNDVNVLVHNHGIADKLDRISGVINENSEDSNTDFEAPSPSIVESSNVPEISIFDSQHRSVSCMKKLENSDSGSETDFEPSSPSHVQKTKVPEISNDSKSEPSSPSVIQSKNEADVDVNNQNDQEDNPVSTSTNGNPGRPSCQYGSKCYRKNPQHVQDFSHPGDNDYSSVDNRPECEYGLSCYRKNPLHRQHYKHTKKVQKPRKAKHPKTTSNDNNSTSEEDNDYDFDDPFINDASSDDYEPEGSDSDSDFSDANGSEEDVKQEKKEFKRQRNKKH